MVREGIREGFTMVLEPVDRGLLDGELLDREGIDRVVFPDIDPLLSGAKDLRAEGIVDLDEVLRVVDFLEVPKVDGDRFVWPPKVPDFVAGLDLIPFEGRPKSVDLESVRLRSNSPDSERP